ncbi:hypothetical protein DLAC_00948 [Tieghemostelium lacteum]|uniref:Uncharacterized protein n=1 Tax=Tieghemostelium lacteum TaxID=361077 RepID=A0A152A7N9_TIELA|nr:hypothetical protein DLAC_00948 [Tieghemostelium lacteum]|eukprot:KYR02145.1 hypothetical protein DLAC_00948 [Tieghemostelium lacteum]
MSNKDNLTQQIERSISSHCYSSAIFFADKLLTLSQNTSSYTECLYILCNALYCDKQYQRSSSLLMKYINSNNMNIVDKNAQLENTLKLKILYLVGKCKIELNEWEQCIDIIGTDNDGFISPAMQLESSESIKTLVSTLCQIRGKCYESLENLKKSRYWYIQSLMLDYHSYESFESLVKNHLLNHREEMELLNQLQFKECDLWLKDLYSTLLKKYDAPQKHTLMSSCTSILSTIDNLKNLKNSNDVQTSLAEYYFYHHQYRLAYNITKRILKEDRHYSNRVCLMVHLSSMFELDMSNELYYTCHQLLETSTQPAISWYGVACYYHLIGNHDMTLRFFTKATTIDSRNGAFWLGFGHFFADKGEHDQAMAAYRTSARLLTGCHLPPLCIGMELIRVHNLNLATQYIQQSKDICPYDPLIHNELGIIEYRNQRYQEAIHHFESALYISANRQQSDTSTHEMISIDQEAWEPTVFNLAHCYRKLRNYDMALQYYNLSQSLSPNNASVYSAIAFTHHLQGNFDEAIDFYHQSLSIRDDSFTNTLLNKALSLSILNYD